MREAFGARTYLVGQILAGLAASEACSLSQGEQADYAIQLADLTIYKMRQQVVHSWERENVTVPAATSNQDEAAL